MRDDLRLLLLLLLPPLLLLLPLLLPLLPLLLLLLLPLLLPLLPPLLLLRRVADLGLISATALLRIRRRRRALRCALRVVVPHASLNLETSLPLASASCLSVVRVLLLPSVSPRAPCASRVLAVCLCRN